jgi:hypothetical protein
MRIKWTSIPKVVTHDAPSPAVPWASPAPDERKKEARKNGEPKKDKKKTERAMDWLRGSR